MSQGGASLPPSKWASGSLAKGQGIIVHTGGISLQPSSVPILPCISLKEKLHVSYCHLANLRLEICACCGCSKTKQLHPSLSVLIPAWPSWKWPCAMLTRRVPEAQWRQQGSFLESRCISCVRSLIVGLRERSCVIFMSMCSSMLIYIKSQFSPSLSDRFDNKNWISQTDCIVDIYYELKEMGIKLKP